MITKCVIKCHLINSLNTWLYLLSTLEGSMGFLCHFDYC